MTGGRGRGGASSARAVGATLRAAVAEAVANRASFWWQATVMVLNDLAWVGFWLLFFREVGSIRGWDADDVLLLFAVLTTAAGIALGVTSNARRIGTMAADGELDAALTLPVPPLAHLLARRVEPVNLGDAMFGVGLFAVAGGPTPARAGLFVLAVLAGATVMIGFQVAIQSLSFFVGRNEAGELGIHAVILLASYPAEVFRGVPKALMYTVVPAAFVSTVPSTLVRDFDPAAAAGLLAVAAATMFAGWALFTLGLRRYTSGAAWSRA